MKKNSTEILDTLSSGPVQKFVVEHQNSDIREMVLKNKVLFSIPVERLSDQIASRRKAKEKLPLYYNTAGIVYPPSENFEQSSSQATAAFKGQWMASELGTSGSTCVDLTGGFGVDTYFLSRYVGKIHYVEPQEPLLEIARHNHQLLGAHNIAYHGTAAEAFVNTTNSHFDLAFIDPSRRAATKRKVHAFTDAQPDILKLQNDILGKADRLLIKASPLLDIQAGISQLSGVKKVVVLSVNNECRELLFLCEKNIATEASIEAVNLFSEGNEARLAFTFSEEKDLEIAYTDPEKYLYEPNASILKAGAFKTVGIRFGLKKISASTHLYTGTELIKTFPGRIFEVEAIVKPDRKSLKPFFPEGKANVTTRNYPLTPEELKKNAGLKDGGEMFLIGFSGRQKKFTVVARRKIQ